MISQSYQRSNCPTSLLQGTANGVCCTAWETPCIKQKSFQRGKTQLINGSPALTPTAKPSFLDSATDFGQENNTGGVSSRGFSWASLHKSDSLAEEPLLCDNPTASKARENAAFTETSRRNDVLLLQTLQKPAVFADSLSLHTTVLQGVEKHKGEAHHVS